ncbi:hypothetical protein FDZ73_23980 [bacterium]|nr:MAG: hypothetical protein FDZ73_23980 [bacterium]
MRRRFSSRFVLAMGYAIVVLAVVSVTFTWYLSRFEWTDPESGVIDHLYGDAYRPYVYRALVPILVQGLEMIYPANPLVLTAAIMFLALLGFALAMRSLATLFWKTRFVAESASILAILALFPFLIRDGKIYDFMALFLFTLGLLFMARQQWNWFLVIFILGCVNKETMVFLSVVFVVHYFRKIPARKYWSLVFLQGFAFGFIKFAITWFFKDNPGGIVQFHLADQIYTMTHFPYFTLLYGSFALCAAIFVFLDWRQKPGYLRSAATSLIPVVFLANLLFGGNFEIRAYLDLYPVLLLLSIPTFNRLYQAFVHPLGGAVALQAAGNRESGITKG